MLEKHATASALIYDQNRVLLIHHRKKQVWIYPGGHVEAYEAPDEAVAREVLEECGLEIDIISTNGRPSYPGARTVALPFAILEILLRRQNHYHLDFVYLAALKEPWAALEPCLPICTDEADELGWFSEAELTGLVMFDDVRAVVIDGFAAIREDSS